MVTANANVVEVEVATGRNADFLFRPLVRVVRGEFNANHFRDKERGTLLAEWPDPIPGQRIGVDLASKSAYVADPLHEPKHEALRDKIKRRGFTIPAERQTFENVHLPTWLYWLKRGVESGAIRITQGELPAKIEGEPNLDFLIKTEKSSNDRLAEAITRQSAALERQADAMEKLIGLMVANAKK